MSQSPETTEDGRAAIRPTFDRLRHDIVIVPSKDRDHQIARPARVETQRMLDRYKIRKTLDEEQLAAAYRWFTLAMLSRRFPRLTMSWEGRVNGADVHLPDSQVAAGIARDRGITHLAGIDPEFVSIVDSVCVDDQSAEGWAIRRKIHPMRGMLLLRKALYALMPHYGMGSRC